MGAWPDWWTDGFASGAREAAVSRITHSNVIANQVGLSFAKMLGAELPTDINKQIAGINNALLFMMNIRLDIVRVYVILMDWKHGNSVR